MKSIFFIIIILIAFVAFLKIISSITGNKINKIFIYYGLLIMNLLKKFIDFIKSDKVDKKLEL